MKSIIGTMAAWHSTPSNPYKVYAYGVKEEGQRCNALFSSEYLAWNALMQDIIDQIMLHPDKNLIWRRFPECTSETFTDSTGEKIVLWKASARFCFE